MFQSAPGHCREQSIANQSSPPTALQLKCVSNTISNWFENHQPQKIKFPPSLIFLSLKTLIEWPSVTVLTASANFLSVLFQLLQYSRQHQSLSAYRAVLMTNRLYFPAFSSRFVDSAIQFCFCSKFSFHKKRHSSEVWQVQDFLGPITILLLCITTNETALFV